MEYIQSIIALLEEANARYSVKGSNRNAISLNPESGTLELRVWHGKKTLAFNLDDQMFEDPSRVFETVEMSANHRITPIIEGEAEEAPVPEE